MTSYGFDNLRKDFLPEGTLKFLEQFGLRLLGLTLVVSGLFLATALASHRSEDSSWNTVTDAVSSNLCGQSGAVISDLLLQSVGFASVLPVLCLVIWGSYLIRAQVIPRLWLKLLVTPFATLLLAVGLAKLPRTFFWPLAIQPGGFAGKLLLSRADLFSAVKSNYELSLITAALSTSVSAVLFLFIFGLVQLPPKWWKHLAWLRLSFLERIKSMRHRKRKKKSELTGTVCFNCDSKNRSDLIKGDDFPKENVNRILQDSSVAKETKITSFGRESSLVNNVCSASPHTPEPDIGSGFYPAVWNRASKSIQLPPVQLLDLPKITMQTTLLSEERLTQNAHALEKSLRDFSVQGRIVRVRPGPIVTLYELEPAPGTKTSRIIGLSDDIARSMGVVSVRIAVVAGHNVIGIELPNARRELVYLRELLTDEGCNRDSGGLVLSLGKDISGLPVHVDLARMPHLLVAGTTGSGKSVALNAMILSLLYRLQPTDCRLIMIDPKMLELSAYNGIPHLLSPVLVNPSEAIRALKWAVYEMENRYRAMSQLGVRNIASYNKRVEAARLAGQLIKRTVQTGFNANTGKPIYEDQTLAFNALPYIVVIIDEISDLMLTAGNDVELAIQRLAQMARAAGVHLIVATQRPTVDVITGTIKANFPTRISFQVSSKIDSRTILGEPGAEQLLGYGDMLYMASAGRVTRVHGPFVTDDEVDRVANYLKSQGDPNYIAAITQEEEIISASREEIPYLCNKTHDSYTRTLATAKLPQDIKKPYGNNRRTGQNLATKFPV